jgi:hypothetical protein
MPLLGSGSAFQRLAVKHSEGAQGARQPSHLGLDHRLLVSGYPAPIRGCHETSFPYLESHYRRAEAGGRASPS